MKKSVIFLTLILIVHLLNGQSKDQNWPQFRGPNGAGVAAESAKPPVDFEKAVLKWNIELQHGVSSPVIWNDRIFLTSYADQSRELQTICINRNNGQTLWVSTVKPDTIEKYSTTIGSPAQASMVTDGDRVISFFGSYGILCYNFDGELLWEYRVACNKATYGIASSPVIAGDAVIFLNDVSTPRYLLALKKTDGSVLWKTKIAPQSIPNTGGYSTPCIKNNTIYVHLVGCINKYSLMDGSLISTFSVLTAGVSSPIICGNQVIAACWYNMSEANQRGKLPDFATLLKNNDKNNNGTISKEEIPDDLLLYLRPEIKEIPATTGPVKNFFGTFDTSKDGEITESEWLAANELLNNFFYQPAGLISLNLKNDNSGTPEKMNWQIKDNIPEVPTPIYCNKRVYIIKDGGILTCVDPESGNVVYSTRIGITGPFMASPVAANGYIYLIGFYGKMKVIKAGDKFEPVAQYEFKENIGATPAIIDNNIYIRTKTRLMAFSGK